MTSIRAQAAARELADQPSDIAAIEAMSVNELAAKYREVYGEPTRSRNKGYLRKRVAWRVQELAYGGLSRRALDKIAELGDEMPERWRMREAAMRADTAPAPTPSPSAHRDPRIPPPGSVITRTYGGASHRVTVRYDGFEYEGDRFKSLSAIAKRITGTAWNGFTFFELVKTGTRADAP